MAPARKHTVKPAECLSSIAFEHGFFWQSLWEHPDNAELRQARDSPFVLDPGDVVHIPEREPREVEVATEARHTFRLKGVPAKLRLRLRTMGQPLANLPYVLECGGQTITGTTDASGRIELFVPPNAPPGTLRVGEGEHLRVYGLVPRALNPVSELDGMQSRLTNLGYYRGPLHGKLDAATVAALERFQRDHDLEVNGRADEATLSMLSDVHLGVK